MCFRGTDVVVWGCFLAYPPSQAHIRAPCSFHSNSNEYYKDLNYKMGTVTEVGRVTQFLELACLQVFSCSKFM